MTKLRTRLLHPRRVWRYGPLRNRWRKFRGKPYTWTSPDGYFSVSGVLGEYDEVIDGHEFHMLRVEFKPFRISGPPATEEDMEEMGYMKVSDDE